MRPAPASQVPVGPVFCPGRPGRQAPVGAGLSVAKSWDGIPMLLSLNSPAEEHPSVGGDKMRGTDCRSGCVALCTLCTRAYPATYSVAGACRNGHFAQRRPRCGAEPSAARGAGFTTSMCTKHVYRDVIVHSMHLCIVAQFVQQGQQTVPCVLSPPTEGNSSAGLLGDVNMGMLSKSSLQPGPAPPGACLTGRPRQKTRPSRTREAGAGRTSAPSRIQDETNVDRVGPP